VEKKEQKWVEINELVRQGDVRQGVPVILHVQAGDPNKKTITTCLTIMAEAVVSTAGEDKISKVERVAS